MEIVVSKGWEGNCGFGARPLTGHHQKTLKGVTKNALGPTPPRKTIAPRAQTSDRYRY